MILVHLFALVLASTPALGQIVYDSIHNATSLVGTWSSGSKGVVTGSGFADPANKSFTYAKTTGVSYSFTGDGFYEIARYRFKGNASQPNCITGIINWSHGTYDLVSNGSIVMTPFGDGYQQIQDTCAAVSNFIEDYNYTELYQSWRIFTDPTDGYKLHLFEFDGSPVAPQFQVSASPNMLPTRNLRNTTTSNSTITTQSAIAMNTAARRWEAAGAGGVLTALLGIGLLSVLL